MLETIQEKRKAHLANTGPEEQGTAALLMSTLSGGGGSLGRSAAAMNFDPLELEVIIYFIDRLGIYFIH